MEIMHPFGPLIGRTLIPHNHVKFINSYVDQLVAKDDLERFDYSNKLVGNVSQELALRPDGVREDHLAKYNELMVLLSDAVKLFFLRSFERHEQGVEQTFHGSVEIAEWSIWIVRQFEKEYNPIHTHLKYDISGVLYTMVPESVLTRRAHREKGARDGTIDFIFGSEQRFCNAKYSIRPEVGLMVVFPSFLFHVVYPFCKSDEERRCLSFNAVLSFAE